MPKRPPKDKLQEMIENQEQQIIELSSTVEENNVKFQAQKVKLRAEINRLKRKLKETKYELDNQQL